jgi:hypothetical protein
MKNINQSIIDNLEDPNLSNEVDEQDVIHMCHHCGDDFQAPEGKNDFFCACCIKSQFNTVNYFEGNDLRQSNVFGISWDFDKQNNICDEVVRLLGITRKRQFIVLDVNGDVMTYDFFEITEVRT